MTKTKSFHQLLCCLLFMLAGVLMGCEGSRAVPQDSQPVPTDTHGRDRTAAGDALSTDLAGDASPTKRCVIAYRHTKDDMCCCQPRVATTADEVTADPCLVEASSEIIPLPAVGCAWGCVGACDCISPPPPSRIVAWRDGRCQFVGECVTSADCILATDTRQCCACPEIFPKKLVEQDSCLEPGQRRGKPSPPFSCASGCNWLCPSFGACMDPGNPDCDITAKLPVSEKVCRGVP